MLTPGMQLLVPQFLSQGSRIPTMTSYPHLVDCFAHIDNTQLPKFYSRFWCPGLTAVDALVNWASDINRWVPLINLVGWVLRHAEACNTICSLVVPAWKSAPFWLLLCPDGSHLAPFVLSNRPCSSQERVAIVLVIP